jgi:hypothetical protein
VDKVVRIPEVSRRKRILQEQLVQALCEGHFKRNGCVGEGVFHRGKALQEHHLLNHCFTYFGIDQGYNFGFGHIKFVLERGGGKPNKEFVVPEK